jgi:hypothetical protein
MEKQKAILDDDTVSVERSTERLKELADHVADVTDLIKISKHDGASIPLPTDTSMGSPSDDQASEHEASSSNQPPLPVSTSNHQASGEASSSELVMTSSTTENNSKSNNTKPSLLDNFADPMQEQPSYMDPDD